MQRVGKIVIRTLAIIGAGYLLLNIVAIAFLSDCQLHTLGSAISPSGRYNAAFEQTICKDAKNTRSSVLVGVANRKDRWVALEVPGTNDVKLTWASDTELVVSYPNASRATKRETIEDGWPVVTVMPR